MGFLYANRAIRNIVPDSSITASWKAVRIFPRLKGGRNDTAAPSSAEDELQTLANVGHRDSSFYNLRFAPNSTMDIV